MVIYSNWVKKSCNSSINRDMIPPVLLLAGIEVVFSLFCLFMVIYLSIRLKKKAWDSPAKRFGHFFNVYFALTFFSYASTNFSIAFNFMSFLICYIPLPLFYVSFLYYTAIYVALVLQIVTPFLPERVKLCTHKIHCVMFSEITSHLFIFLLLLSCYVPLSHYTDAGYIIFGICGIVLVLFLLFSFVLIFTFAFLIRFFKNYNINKNPLKYMIIKVLFLLNCIAFIITSVIATEYTFSFLFIQMILYFILSVSVVSLNHPLDIWYCKCCCRRSPDRAPLLPVNDTEGQQTNPISVWDHRNVPSYTVTNVPYDMSDCRTDYEQLA